MRKHTLYRIMLCALLFTFVSCSKDKPIDDTSKVDTPVLKLPIRMVIPFDFEEPYEFAYDAQNRLTEIKRVAIDYSSNSTYTSDIVYGSDGKISKVFIHDVDMGTALSGSEWMNYSDTTNITLPFLYKNDSIFTSYQSIYNSNLYITDTLIINEKNQLVKLLNGKTTVYTYDARGNQLSPKFFPHQLGSYNTFDNKRGFASCLNTPSWFAAFMFSYDFQIPLIMGVANNAIIGDGSLFYPNYDKDGYPVDVCVDYITANDSIEYKTLN